MAAEMYQICFEHFNFFFITYVEKVTKVLRGAFFSGLFSSFLDAL